MSNIFDFCLLRPLKVLAHFWGKNVFFALIHHISYSTEIQTLTLEGYTNGSNGHIKPRIFLMDSLTSSSYVLELIFTTRPPSGA